MDINLTANPIVVTITNLLTPGQFTHSWVGKRTIMSLATAKDMRICDFDFVLNAEGNFMKWDEDTQTAVDYADGANVNGDGTTYDDQVAVIARVAEKATDRYIQFFATQQKVLLAAGDVLTFNVKTAAEAAHYMGLAVDGEIEVEVAVASEDEASE